jgi:Copper type II ascorbate-dependent monooxygenase, C-terminal domain
MVNRRPRYLGSATIGCTVTLIAAALASGGPRGTAGSATATAGAAQEAPYVARKAGTLTFNHDIAPIVYRNCAGCHREGEVAPFALTSYTDVKKRARQIAMVTQSRFMPPWKADSHGEFLDERRLTAEQIGMIGQWAAEDAPEGRAADLPPAPKFTEGWQLGPPDVVVEPAESYTLAAEGADVYRCFVVPTPYAEDRYVAAIEVRPGNRAVVHHMIAYLDTAGAARKLDAADADPGYTSFGGVGFPPAGALGGWAPGNLPRRLPAGTGILLPKGADIVMQVHYHRSGKTETDRTRMGIYFAKGTVDKRLRVLPIAGRPLRIPAGEANYTAQANLPIPADVTVLQVTPHMHLLGREMTVTATLPDGAQKPLVRVPDWDFNWQTTYSFKEPLKLPRGSRISLTARYDNSAANPLNPNNPPREVTWGEQTTDEMCLAFVGYTVDAEHLSKGIAAPGFLPEFGGNGRPGLQLLIRRFDKNGDGRLDAEERKAAAAALSGLFPGNRGSNR